MKGDPLREFDGYVNKEATNKKLCKSVFSKGDTAFLTGQTLHISRLGHAQHILPLTDLKRIGFSSMPQVGRK